MGWFDGLLGGGGATPDTTSVYSPYAMQPTQAPSGATSGGLLGNPMMLGGLLAAAELMRRQPVTMGAPQPDNRVPNAIGGFARGGALGTQIQGEQAKLGFLQQDAASKGLTSAIALEQFNQRRALAGLPPIAAPAGLLGPLGQQSAGTASPPSSSGLLGSIAPGAGGGLPAGGAGPTGALPPGAGLGSGALSRANLATMSRQDAGDLVAQMTAAGFNEKEIAPYAEYAKTGVLGGYENTPTGMKEIAGGPQSQEQQVQQALNKQGFMQGPDGVWRNPQGVVASEAQKAAAIEGAKTRAGLPAQMALKTYETNEEIRKAGSIPRDVPPGGTLIQPDGKGGTKVLYTSPFPAPGTPENALNQSRGKTAGEMYDEAVKGGFAAEKQNAVMGKQLEQLDSGLKTGTGFDQRKWLSDLFTTLGADPAKVKGLMNSTQAGLFNNASRELLIDRAKAMGANPSNAEDRYILETIVSGNSPTEAARALLQWKMQRNNALASYGQGMHQAVDIEGKHPVSYAYGFARENPTFAIPSAPGAPEKSGTLSPEIMQKAETLRKNYAAGLYGKVDDPKVRDNVIKQLKDLGFD